MTAEFRRALPYSLIAVAASVALLLYAAVAAPRPTPANGLVARAWSLAYGDSEAMVRRALGKPVREDEDRAGVRTLRFESEGAAVEATLGPSGVTATLATPDAAHPATTYRIVGGAPYNPSN